MRDRRARRRNQHARDDTVQHAEDDKAGDVVDGHPCEQQHHHRHRRREVHLHGANARRGQHGHGALEERPRAHERQQIERKVLALAQRRGRIHGDVEGRDVERDVVEQWRERKQRKARLAEGAQIEQGAPPARALRAVREDDGERHGGEDEVDEGDGAHRPGEADGRHEAAQHEGEDDTADAAARVGAADGPGAG